MRRARDFNFMTSLRRLPFLGLGAAVSLGGGLAWSAVAVFGAGPRADGTALTPQGWRLTPAGRQVPLGPGPLAVGVTPDGERVLVIHAGYARHSLLVLDARTGDVLQDFPGAEDGSHGYYVGLAISRSGHKVYASDGAGSGLRTFDIRPRPRPDPDGLVSLCAGSPPHAGHAVRGEHERSGYRPPRPRRIHRRSAPGQSLDHSCADATRAR